MQEVIVRLRGGLGNQMFQYALGRHIASLNKATLILDISALGKPGRGMTRREFELSTLNISAKIIPEVNFLWDLIKNFTNKFRRPRHQIVRESNFCFDRNVLSRSGDIILDGYWQSFYYFESIRDILLSEFSLRDSLDSARVLLQREIEKTQSLAIHIRRGDYISNKFARALHETCSLDYFQRAVLKIQTLAKIDKVFVFSDDPEWVSNNLRLGLPLSIIQPFSIPSHDLLLMSNANHFILSNSSFGWWAAWLSQNPTKIVVVPKQWFRDEKLDTKDLCPPTWIRL